MPPAPFLLALSAASPLRLTIGACAIVAIVVVLLLRLPRRRLAGPGRDDDTSPPAVCPRCRRAFARGRRSCPHDHERLRPGAPWVEGVRVPPIAAFVDVGAKLCLECGARGGLGILACARDGHHVVTLN